MTSSIKSLGSIAKFVNGGTPPKQNSEYWSGDILWISSADIENDVITSKRHYITHAAVEASATNRVPKGTLLVVTRTGVGKTAIADEDLCFSQDITAVYLPSDCDPRYVRFAIQSNREYLVKNARGATIKGVTRQMLADLQIPLPPLAEQRRIAEQFEMADRLVRSHEQAIAKLIEIKLSLQNTFFSDN